MKIGIYDPYLDTLSGGEKYMLSIALCLAKEHQVTILWDKTSLDEIKEVAKKRFDFDLSQLHFAKSPFSPTISLSKRFSKTKKYDLIIALSDGSIPIVHTKLILHFQSPMPWVNGKTLKNKLKLFRVKKIIVNSKFTQGYIERNFGRKTVLLYPPVTIMREYKVSKKEKIILNVGRFGINQAGSSFKKQDVLADTFVKMVDDSLKGWRLCFVMNVKENDAEAFAQFKEKYSKYPIEILQNPSNDVLWDYYEKASIYWHASGFGEDLMLHPDRAEHFGISTVEAMGTGAVPVVVNAGGQKEIVESGKNGMLWSSQEELVKETLSLINDEARLHQLAEQGVKDAAAYSLERFCSEVNKLIA